MTQSDVWYCGGSGPESHCRAIKHIAADVLRMREHTSDDRVSPMPVLDAWQLPAD